MTGEGSAVEKLQSGHVLVEEIAQIYDQWKDAQLPADALDAIAERLKAILTGPDAQYLEDYFVRSRQAFLEQGGNDANYATLLEDHALTRAFLDFYSVTSVWGAMDVVNEVRNPPRDEYEYDYDDGSWDIEFL